MRETKIASPGVNLSRGPPCSVELWQVPDCFRHWPFHFRARVLQDTFHAADPWSELPAILARIKPPSFPDREFDVTKFGAIGDNKTDCTEAFQKAIAACHAAKGGRVLVPAGEFITGAIRLKSNVNLHISSGATVRFARDPGKYPLVFTRWEGIELMNYSPFIYAFEEENIAITGAGTIDGNADCEHWWPWKGRTKCGWNPGAAQSGGRPCVAF